MTNLRSGIHPVQSLINFSLASNTVIVVRCMRFGAGVTMPWSREETTMATFNITANFTISEQRADKVFSEVFIRNSCMVMIPVSMPWCMASCATKPNRRECSTGCSLV